MNWLRVFFAGGLTSYRALFVWINPWVFVPMLVAYPVFQTVFYVYLGRAAGVANDAFFLIGNSFVAAAITGLFGMSHAIGGERRFQTLPMLLASPASRLALFCGRAVPTVVNGFVVAVISYLLAAAMLDVAIPVSRLGGISLTLLVTCLSCAALGMCIGSLAFRTRSLAVFADSIGASLLVVTGANVPFDRLPDIVRTIASGLPLTHGLAAARALADGDTVSSVLPAVGRELVVGVIYLAIGLTMLRYFEHSARTAGSTDRY